MALIARVTWVALAWSRHGPALEFPDERLHWDLARNLILHFDMQSEGRHLARMPLYPLFLAPFAIFDNLGVLLARLAQAAIGAWCAALLYRLTRDMFGARAALIAGLLAAIDPFSIFFSNLLMTEVPFIATALHFSFASWRVARSGVSANAGDVFAVGSWAAASLLLRSAAAPYIAAMWLLLAILSPSIVVATRRTLVYIAILAAAMAPWGLRNYLVAGDMCLLSANAGLTLYDSVGPLADGSSDQSFLALMPELDTMSEVERDRHLQKLAWIEIRSDPGRIARLAWAKFLRTWSLSPNAPGYTAGATAWASAVFTIGVLTMAFVGVFRALLADAAVRRALMILATPVVVFTLLHCVYVGSLRYRVPMMPFVEAIGGAAVILSKRSQGNHS